MDIVTATENYESWLSKQMKLDKEGMRRKHEAMASDEFSFMRATYYRWAQLLPAECPELYGTPKLLSVGDLHVENFGTWRDAEGRLVWGVNDFDEVATLPYANDLIRLSLSAQLALKPIKRADSIWADASAAILVGYSDRMRRAVKDGLRKIHPIVLAETNHWLTKIAEQIVHDPKRFWSRLESQMPETVIPIAEKSPPTWQRILRRAVPKRSFDVVVRMRYAGLGSMGRPRYVASGQWCGSRFAREVKALAIPASKWAGASNSKRIAYDVLLNDSIRSRDPFALAADGWILRRLAPDCARIPFDTLPDKTEMDLFYAMGEETANMHLASPKVAQAIVADLDSRRGDWLVEPVVAMTDALKSDFASWRAHYQAMKPDTAVADAPKSKTASKTIAKSTVVPAPTPLPESMPQTPVVAVSAPTTVKRRTTVQPSEAGPQVPATQKAGRAKAATVQSTSLVPKV